MSKEIAIQGIQRNNPDSSTPDGTCQELINLRYDSGAWRPVGTKKKWGGYAAGTSYFVHSVGTAKNKICKYNGTIRWDKMVGYPNINPSQHVITNVGVNDVVRFEAIGNILTIFNETRQTVSWAIWSPEKIGAVIEDKYDYIEQLPDLPVLSFKTAVEKRNEYHEYAYEGDAPASIIEIQQFIKNQAIAHMAKKRSEWYDEGLFDGYFFLTYAFELFDGSVVKHSNPVALYGGNLEMAYQIHDFDINNGNFLGENTHLYVWVRYSNGMKIACRNVDASKLLFTLKHAVDLSPYKQLIRSLNLYISPIHTIDFSANIPANRVNLPGQTYFPVHYKVDELPSLTFEREASFFLLKRLSIENMSAYLTEQLVKENLNKLVSKPTLPTDNSSHHRIYADASKTYNSRLFLGDVRTTLFNGWCPKYYNDAGNKTNVFTRVTLHTADGIKTADSEMLRVSEWFNFPLIVSYPDARAIRMDFVTDELVNGGNNTLCEESQGSKSWSLQLTPHPTLNIAFAIAPMCMSSLGVTVNEFKFSPLTMCKSDSFLSSRFRYKYKYPDNGYSQYTNNEIIEPNRIQLSEFSNPFYYPAKHSDNVGNRILGFSANSIPLSQGQSGQHPMFVFTAQGMWAMSIGVDPFIQAITPINGEVVTDKRNIVNIGGVTVFKTGEGLQLVEGSKVVNLSDSLRLLDNALATSPSSGFSHVTESTLLGATQPYISGVTFLEYLKNARIGFDSTLRELYVTNPTYSYTYVLSMKHNYWFKVNTSGRELFADYPNFYLVKGNDLYELNNESSADQQVFIQTRPIDLEFHGFKKLKRAILRAKLNTTTSTHNKFGVYLFGSVDGVQWTALTGKEVEKMVRDVTISRELPSVKFLTLVASGRINADSFITSISVDGEPKLTSKLR